MKTYHQINLGRISEILMQASLGVSAVCGYSSVTLDMVHSLSELHRVSWDGLKEPFYIAIREMGTESGSKEHCIGRCRCLGYPLVIAKLEYDNVMDFNMTIMFTHNWMFGNNNYMEQEFDSI